MKMEGEGVTKGPIQRGYVSKVRERNRKFYMYPLS
jgi:hypothetical protein